MVVYNYSGKEINAKIVYYGPALSGKTTNLEWIYSKIPVEYSGKMVSLRTQADRTIFFDFLPLDLGMIDGFRTRFMLYTVPGQVHYNATRKMVLKGVDGVVFVADSEPGRMQDNIESLQNLRDNLQELGMNPDSLPLVLQWNKRDLPGCMDVSELEHELNPRALPSFEACALTGEGVYETLHKASRMMYGRMTGDGAPGVNPTGDEASLFGESIAECLQDVDHPEPEPERVAVAPVSRQRSAPTGADALGAILGNGAAPSSEAEAVQEAAIEVPTVGASAPVPAATQSAAMRAAGSGPDPVSPGPPSSLPPEQVPATLDGPVEDVIHNLHEDSSEVDSVNEKHEAPGSGQNQETVADRLDAFFQSPESPQPSRPAPPVPPQQPAPQASAPQQPATPPPAPQQPAPPAQEPPQAEEATDGFDVEHDVDVIEELSDASRGPGASEPVDLDAMFSEIGAVPVREQTGASGAQTPPAPAKEPEASELEDLGLITDPLKTKDEARAISRSVSSISAVSGGPFSGGALGSGPVSAGPTASRILEVPVTLDQSVLEQGGSIRIVLNVTVK
jgi:signal recognition particle receptor subunit beta